MASNLHFRIPSLIEKEMKKLEICLNECKKDYLLIGLNQKQTDCVLKSMSNMLSKIQDATVLLLKKTVTPPEKIVNDLFGRSTSILNGIDSQYKR